MIVLVNSQDEALQYKLLAYILNIPPRVVCLEIKTAKYYSSFSDPQMLEMEIHGVVKSLARMLKME